MQDEACFRRILFLSGTESARSRRWQPPADVYRTPRGWLVKFELAGVEPQDISVTLQAGRLVLRGVRRDECLVPGGRCYRLEIAYSEFERVLELPELPHTAQLVTSYRQGMFTVEVTTQR